MLGDQRVGGRLVGREGDQRAVVPLLDRLAGARHQPGAEPVARFGRGAHVDGPPGHAPSASLSLDQNPGERLGGSPSSLASSWKSRSCSSVSRSGRPHVDPDEQVALDGLPQHREPLALEPQHRLRLGAGRDPDLLVAVGRRDGELPPSAAWENESGRSKIRSSPWRSNRSSSLMSSMTSEVAGRAVARARRALAPQRQVVVARDARRESRPSRCGRPAPGPRRGRPRRARG